MDVTYHSPAYRPYACRNYAGFSLIEFVIVIAIMAILLGIAAPAFTAIINDYRISSTINRFNGILSYARSEATKRIQRTMVCKSADGNNCDNSIAWHDGWMVFVDTDGDRTRSAGETILLVQQKLDRNITMSYSAFPSDNYVIYYANGLSMGNGTFTFCSPHGEDQPRALVLYKTGRLRHATIKPDGTPLECP